MDKLKFFKSEAFIRFWKKVGTFSKSVHQMLTKTYKGEFLIIQFTAVVVEKVAVVAVVVATAVADQRGQ